MIWGVLFFVFGLFLVSLNTGGSLRQDTVAFCFILLAIAIWIVEYMKVDPKLHDVDRRHNR